MALHGMTEGVMLWPPWKAVRAGRTVCLLAVLVVMTLTACQAGNRRGPFITASPNPVPAGPGGTGSTTITWNAGEDRPGRVMGSVGREEALFAIGGTGTVNVPWIGDNTVYEFRLYDDRSNTLLASVKVTRGVPWWRVYAIAVVVVAVLIGAAVVYRSRVRRR